MRYSPPSTCISSVPWSCTEFWFRLGVAHVSEIHLAMVLRTSYLATLWAGKPPRPSYDTWEGRTNHDLLNQIAIIISNNFLLFPQPPLLSIGQPGSPSFECALSTTPPLPPPHALRGYISNLTSS